VRRSRRHLRLEAQCELQFARLLKALLLLGVEEVWIPKLEREAAADEGDALGDAGTLHYLFGKNNSSLGIPLQLYRRTEDEVCHDVRLGEELHALHARAELFEEVAPTAFVRARRIPGRENDDAGNVLGADGRTEGRWNGNAPLLVDLVFVRSEEHRYASLPALDRPLACARSLAMALHGKSWGIMGKSGQ